MVDLAVFLSRKRRRKFSLSRPLRCQPLVVRHVVMKSAALSFVVPCNQASFFNSGFFTFQSFQSLGI